MEPIQVRKYPKLIEEFANENFNLKTLIAALLAITFLNGLILVIALKKGPLVIPLRADGSTARIDGHVNEAQVQAAVKEYIATRYTWTDSTISGQLKKAEFFVAPALVSAFKKAMLETQKFVREKKVLQRVYPRTIEVSFKDKLVTVIADRFTLLDNLKAATEMKLLLNFDLGERTVMNPWGVYITKETERAPL